MSSNPFDDPHPLDSDAAVPAVATEKVVDLRRLGHKRPWWQWNVITLFAALFALAWARELLQLPYYSTWAACFAVVFVWAVAPLPGTRDGLMFISFVVALSLPALLGFSLVLGGANRLGPAVLVLGPTVVVIAIVASLAYFKQRRDDWDQDAAEPLPDTEPRQRESLAPPEVERSERQTFAATFNAPEDDSHPYDPDAPSVAEKRRVNLRRLGHKRPWWQWNVITLFVALFALAWARELLRMPYSVTLLACFGVAFTWMMAPLPNMRQAFLIILIAVALCLLIAATLALPLALEFLHPGVSASWFRVAVLVLSPSLAVLTFVRGFAYFTRPRDK